MHILLTRPLEDCTELALKFQSLGHKISHLPLLNIEKINYDKIDFYAEARKNNVGGEVICRVF